MTQESTRVPSLLERMSLQEKIGQLNQLPGPEDRQLEIIRAGGVGSFVLNRRAGGDPASPISVSVEFLNRAQRTAVEESRLGIPILIGRDVIHGFRTVFPIPLGQAATWDPGAVGAAARLAASEARAHSIHWTFTPMLDICRDGRWGRIAEGFGEDPWLCSRLAEAAVRAYRERARGEGVACCAKHFAAYGAAEGGRDYNSAEISERSLHDIYLPPFHAAVAAGVDTIMSAFNNLNGLPTAANPKLLRETLREQWGFTGLVVSDWNALNELLNHGVARDQAEAAALAAKAGVDIDMIAGAFAANLAQLVAKGALSESVIDEAAARVLRLKEGLGLFDQPYAKALASPQAPAAKGRELARRMAADSIVLLKNAGDILPLSPSRDAIAVTGPLASAKDELLGTWAPDGWGEDVVRVIDGIRSKLGPKVQLIDGGVSNWISISQARQAGVVVAVLGEHPLRSGEAGAVSDIGLPPGQLEILRSLASAGVSLIAVVISGRPLAIKEVLELADAVLYVFHPGIEGGNAIADVLFGDAEPGGRLPVTLPRSVGQIPIYYAYHRTGRPPEPALRDCSQYLDEDWRPLREFGFGLSYTRFEYSDLKLERSRVEIRDGSPIRLSVKVTNVGDRAGSEVVQIYVSDLHASLVRPVKELKGFEKVRLEAGRSRTLSFEVAPADLAFFNGRELVTEPGEFKLLVGPDSCGELSARVELI